MTPLVSISTSPELIAAVTSARDLIRALANYHQEAKQDAKDYLYRGIAARQFQRVFVLAEGMQVNDARLRNGLLSIDLTRPEISNVVKKINISVSQ